MRMVIVWIYNNTGKSVLAANLYHTTDNVSWSLFPNYGSHYNPRVTGMLTWLVVVLILFGWGAKALGRYRHARASRVSGLTQLPVAAELALRPASIWEADHLFLELMNYHPSRNSPLTIRPPYT